MGWLEWINNPYNQNLLNSKNRSYKKEDLLKTLTVWNKNNDLSFAFCSNDKKKYFGNIRISLLNKTHKSCTFGRLVGNANNHSQGLGKIMTYKTMELVFDKLKFNKLWTHVFTDNKQSIYSNLKVGLEVEGFLKRHFHKNGIYKDVFSLGINKDQYSKIKIKLRSLK